MQVKRLRQPPARHVAQARQIRVRGVECAEPGAQRIELSEQRGVARQHVLLARVDLVDHSRLQIQGELGALAEIPDLVDQAVRELRQRGHRQPENGQGADEPDAERHDEASLDTIEIGLQGSHGYGPWSDTGIPAPLAALRSAFEVSAGPADS